MTENDLSPASITKDLDTRFIGQRVLYYPSITSTMEVARREVLAGTAEGTIVTADEQTAGRGRIKRPWLSPKGSIAVSVVLYPKITELPSLIMISSLAVVRCINRVTGLKAQIKWPNDVLIRGKKVCGILIENGVRRNNVDYAVIGIGLNINLRIVDLPEIHSIATSLSDELGREVSRLDVLRCLLSEMEKLYLTLKSGQSPYEEWRDDLLTLGKRIRVKWGETVYEGTAESVGRDGSLLLREPNGRLTTIVAGDATLSGQQ
ncbi:MAG: biotin--[acetyl-CoA-carboxylase] ligase [Dehalococcoidales bacterium]|nr:biotin--[acetyl-CoA-carboxylase] ligase [Dehalococcoidales bacterium]